MEDKFPQLFDSIKKSLALVLLVLVLLDILQFVVTFTVGHITVVCGYSWQKLQLSEVTVVCYSCPNPVPEGHTDTPQLNNTPQMLAEYIQ